MTNLKALGLNIDYASIERRIAERLDVIEPLDFPTLDSLTFRIIFFDQKEGRLVRHRCTISGRCYGPTNNGLLLVRSLHPPKEDYWAHQDDLLALTPLEVLAHSSC